VNFMATVGRRPLISASLDRMADRYRKTWQALESSKTAKQQSSKRRE